MSLRVPRNVTDSKLKVVHSETALRHCCTHTAECVFTGLGGSVRYALYRAVTLAGGVSQREILRTGGLIMTHVFKCQRKTWQLHAGSTIQDRTMGTRRVLQLKEIMLWNDSRGWNGRSIFRKITEILRVETILHKSYRVLIPGCSERIITFSGLSRQDVARFFTTSVQNRHEKSCYYYYLYYFQSLWFSLQFYFFAARWSTILQGDCTKLSREDFLQFF